MVMVNGFRVWGSGLVSWSPVPRVDEMGRARVGVGVRPSRIPVAWLVRGRVRDGTGEGHRRAGWARVLMGVRLVLGGRGSWVRVRGSDFYADHGSERTVLS